MIQNGENTNNGLDIWPEHITDYGMSYKYTEKNTQKQIGNKAYIFQVY